MPFFLKLAENALIKRIDVKIKSSPFESKSKKPCAFILPIKYSLTNT
jgi:hypothetical protein